VVRASGIQPLTPHVKMGSHTTQAIDLIEIDYF
jgi:hypothetical protein